MLDLIGRQAAIDAVRKLYIKEPKTNNDYAYDMAIDEADDAIRELPSAHPEMDEWCTNCKEYDHERHCCPRFNRVIREALSERKTGRWVDRSDGGRILYPWWESRACSQCGEYGTAAWRFCPNCGADMRGGVDGADGNG